MKWAIILLVGFLGLVQFHAAEFSSGFTQIMGDRIDARYIAYIAEHLFRAAGGNAEWLSPAMFFPVKETLGYSDALLLHSLLYAPARFFGWDPLSALQFAVIVLNFLTFASTALFLRRGLALSALASTVGALFFSFNSAKLNQLNHIQLQPLLLVPPMAWLLWSLLRDLGQQNARTLFVRLTGAGILFHVQLLTAVYIAWYFAFWCLLFLVFWLALEPEKRRALRNEILTHKKPLCAAAALLLVAAIPFLRIYVPVVLETGTRAFAEAKPMIPRWQSLFWMDSTNYVWGWLAQVYPKFYELPLWWEHRIGLGVVITFGMPIAGFLLARSYRQTAAVSQKNAGLSKNPYTLPLVLCASVLLFYALGMIYGKKSSPWWVVFAHIPGASSIRAVARYVLVTAFPISLLLALGVDFLRGRFSSFENRLTQKNGVKGLAAVAVVFLFVEQLGAQQTFSKTAELAKMKSLAAQLPPGCETFYLTSSLPPPEHMSEWQVDALAVALESGLPTLNGYSGQAPKDWPFGHIGGGYNGETVQAWRKKMNLTGEACSVELR